MIELHKLICLVSNRLLRFKQSRCCINCYYFCMIDTGWYVKASTLKSVAMLDSPASRRSVKVDVNVWKQYPRNINCGDWGFKLSDHLTIVRCKENHSTHSPTSILSDFLHRYCFTWLNAQGISCHVLVEYRLSSSIMEQSSTVAPSGCATVLPPCVTTAQSL